MSEPITDAAYIGRCKTCNRIQAARVDTSKRSKAEADNVALDIGWMFMSGLTVERVTNQVVRLEGFCECGKTEAQTRLF